MVGYFYTFQFVNGSALSETMYLLDWKNVFSKH